MTKGTPFYGADALSTLEKRKSYEIVRLLFVFRKESIRLMVYTNLKCEQRGSR